MWQPGNRRERTARSYKMCLAIPGRVVSVKGDRAVVDYGGTVTEANISLVVPEVGDYVIVHAGFAIEKLDVNEARRALREWNKVFLGAGNQ